MPDEIEPSDIKQAHKHITLAIGKLGQFTMRKFGELAENGRNDKYLSASLNNPAKPAAELLAKLAEVEDGVNCLASSFGDHS